MRVLVTGGRDYANRELVFDVLDCLHSETPISCIIHGACGDDAANRSPAPYRGADRWADEWAIERGVPVERYPAKWRLLGAIAGPERNRRMLRESLPGMVIAFPGGKGTEGMTELALKALGPMFVRVVRGIIRA